MKNIGKIISWKIGQRIPFSHLGPNIIHVQHGQSVVKSILNNVPFLKEHYLFMKSIVTHGTIFKRSNVFFEIRHSCKPKNKERFLQ